MEPETESYGIFTNVLLVDMVLNYKSGIELGISPSGRLGSSTMLAQCF